MLETFYQNLMINQEKEENIKCEDLTNKKEFLIDVVLNPLQRKCDLGGVSFWIK